MSKLLIKSILSLIIFSVACAAGVFMFWIGGGKPFTQDAGWCALFTTVIAGYMSSAPWVFIKD